MATARPLWAFDALAPLLVYVVVLLGVPSELIVEPLGAAGTPAQILGIAFALWWLLSRLLRRRHGGERHGPVAVLLLVFVVAMQLSYAVGAVSPRAAVEHSSADRWLLTLMAWVGVTLATAEALSTRRKLDTALKLVCVGTVGIALLGMVQFFFGIDIAHFIQIPGLHANHAFGALSERSSFRRVSGTTIHPIEFGVVLSSVLPLLVHFAVHSGQHRRWWWLGACAVAAALPMSVARTAILGAVVAVAVAFWSWPRPVRRRVLLLLPFALVAMRSAVPGLLGTIKSLFLNAGSDPSTAGRTDDYAPVWHYVTQDPVTGRGVGTFIPGLYRTLDNQYLGMLVEAGVVGLLALLALLGGGVVVGLVLGRRMPLAADRSLGVALAAGLAVPLLTLVTFDGLAFPMAAGITFLLLGATSALWRLGLGSAHPHRVPADLRLWVPRTAAVAVAAAALLVPHQAWLLSQHTRYQAEAVVLVEIPTPRGVNPYLKSGRAEKATGLLHLLVDGPETRERLASRVSGADYGIAVGAGSVQRGTDVVKSASSLTIRVTSASRDRATALRAALLDETAATLRRMQQQVEVPPSVQLSARPLEQPAVAAVHGSMLRGLVAQGLAWLLVVCAVGAWLRRRAGGGRAPAPVTRTVRDAVAVPV